MNRLFLNDIEDFRRSFDQLFQSVWSPAPARTAAPSADWTFTPPVESGWTDEHLNLRVVIPGVSEKDLNVTVQGNQLYVKGERKAPESFGKEGYVWSSIPYGKFERVFELPAGLDVEKLQAHLHDGFLDIRIPVAGAMKPKQIQINTRSDEGAKQIAA